MSSWYNASEKDYIFSNLLVFMANHFQVSLSNRYKPQPPQEKIQGQKRVSAFHRSLSTRGSMATSEVHYTGGCAAIAQSVQRWATGWTTGVRFPARVRDFSLNHRVRTGSGAHPALYPMSTGDAFTEGKADHSPPFSAEVKNGGTTPPLPHASAWCLIN
jgi:hypothetical protein